VPLRPVSTGSFSRRRNADGDDFNARTMVHALVPAPEPKGFRQTFVRHYARLKALLEAVRAPGLAVVAFDSTRGELAGSLCLEAREDEARVAIVGRHTEVDLPLPGHGELSLRHLALIVHPCAPSARGHAGRDGDELRFSVLDLRTRGAFFDEAGRRLEAVSAEGPIFLSVGSYQLFLIPTEAEPCWPDDGDDGWECIPERVYLDESAADPRRRRRRRRRAKDDKRAKGDENAGEGDARDEAHLGSSTVVRTSLGPRFAPSGALLDDDEAAIGVLRISSQRRESALTLGPKAAKRGVLLGRYDRCNAASILTHGHLSRVHLLIVQIGATLYAVDTGSTNGTWISVAGPGTGEELESVRMLALPATRETTLELGEDLASVDWTPA
jgi:hypothetical protein